MGNECKRSDFSVIFLILILTVNTRFVDKNIPSVASKRGHETKTRVLIGLSLKQGTRNRAMGMGNGESLKWGTFKSGNL